MSNSDAQQIAVTKISLDAPGVRRAGTIDGVDIPVEDIQEVLDGIDRDIALTEKALKSPELEELAQSVRGAHIAIQSIAFHLQKLHMGLYRGSLNYAESPFGEA